MPKSENQKYKALYVAKYLLEYSDADHFVKTRDIIDYLESECGIVSERRSVYRDIAALRDVFGMDIEGGQGGRFCLASRQFDFDELCLLAECVYATKFISERQAKNLVSTISEFASSFQAEKLEQEVFLCDRIKSSQRGTMAIISTIREAMATKRNGKAHSAQKIVFKYLKHTLQPNHETTYRRGGADYIVSPYKLLINEGNYYLLGYDDSVREIRTYRIDRMENVHLCDEPREGENLFESLNIESYVRRVFGMYGGETKRVTIRFVNKLLDTAVDRFGSDGSAHYLSDGDNHFTVSAEVDISRQFFGWICGFETDATIISPPEVVEQMKQFVDSIANCYRS